MRRMDFKGEKVWIGAWALIAWVIDSRFAAEKMEGSPRLVIRRVFEGGEGVESWGRSERSRERFGERRRLSGGVSGGDIVRVAMGGWACCEVVGSR